MEPFARIIVGYHGCTQKFAKELLLAKKPISEWRPSANEWDWLGNGISFWEHAPQRALRWAQERYRKGRQRPAILGAYLQLGRCFDLLNEATTALLSETYQRLTRTFTAEGLVLPQNRGREGKRRELDCLVINRCIEDLHKRAIQYDTVRGAFLEGIRLIPPLAFAARAIFRSRCAIPLAFWVSFSQIWKDEQTLSNP
jgi:hypothetical protein